MDDKEPTALLLNADKAAKLLGIGRTLFWKLHATGKLGPMPVNLGRRTLWSEKELKKWVEFSCPNRDKWLECKKTF